MLMGSVMYFDGVDVMVILGTSFKYRRNEVVEFSRFHLFVVHVRVVSSICLRLTCSQRS